MSDLIEQPHRFRPRGAIDNRFISWPHINVTWSSGLGALAEIGTGMVFGIAGVQEVNNGRNPVF
ncbi:hypothetical protein [Mycobacterium sp.]|uniref:hypothetical protein n=1 Tax=Mycobacterium sp. TaxID=1785 RepID=UPI0031DA3965